MNKFHLNENKQDTWKCDSLIGHIISINLPLGLRPITLVHQPPSCAMTLKTSWAKGLVSRFITLSIDGTLSTTTSCLATISLIKWKRLRICLDFIWDLGSFTCAIAPLLSHNNGIGFEIVGTTLKVYDELLQLDYLLDNVTRGKILSLYRWIRNGGLLGTLPRHCSPVQSDQESRCRYNIIWV